MELERGQVKLYCNQVFIADNIKEVIPEYLMLLNGIIDCPDIPLNVSRSFLQNDKQVQKISKHIVKKVADKLSMLFKNDREQYNSCWSDLANFVKFGCIKDNEFFEKVKNILIYKDLNDNYVNFEEFTGKNLFENANETADDNQSEVKTIYYISDMEQQAHYVSLFKTANINAIICDTFIDPHFLTFLEYNLVGKVKFVRIDADVDTVLKEENSNNDEVILDIFKNVLQNDKITIKTENLKNVEISAIITVDEYLRRYQEMGQMYGMEESEMPKTIIINLNNKVISSLKTLQEDKRNIVVKHIYLLALNAFKKLSTQEAAEFIETNNRVLEFYVNN